MGERPVPPTRATVIVLADDLIWASRLREAARRAGATSVMTRSSAELIDALSSAGRDAPVLVDLNGRSYDGVNEVRAAAEHGHRVLAVAQHEDLALRRRALAAGARRVFSYNKLFADGPRVVTSLIEGRL